MNMFKGVNGIMADRQREIYEMYCGYVYAIISNCLRNCGNTEDIEDCVVETFTDLFHLLRNSPKSDDELKCIISVIAKRKAIDKFRLVSFRNNKTVPIDDYETELVSDMDISETAERSELQRTILECINKLKKPDPQIIIQHYYYGLSLNSIAERLDMTESAVQKRIQRARQKLKKMLEKAGINGV